MRRNNIFAYGKAILFHDDCFSWLEKQDDNSIQAIVTDPPYGLQEYTSEEVSKLRKGKGGIWRLPPDFDGCKRSPMPRFSILNDKQLVELYEFFLKWGSAVLPKLVPGANVVVASNPLLSYILSKSLADAGLERRGEIIRLTMTMRGGDKPKNAEKEFPDVCVMPRSQWEPWVLFRKPLEKGTRIQDNLRKWKVGGFRRIDAEHPFGDVIKSSPTRPSEKKISDHPSLKPQSFLRQIVRAVLPLGEGCVVDTFAGSGSTLAACEAVGYQSMGVERDLQYYKSACESIPKLAKFQVDDKSSIS